MPEWPHAPTHRLDHSGAYMVTGGTYRKQPFFHSSERLALLHDRLLELALHYGWRLQAWAILVNHYHFIAIAPERSETLRKLLRHLHSDTARRVNLLDGVAGRRVWFNFWDTHLTYERSYFARLRYVHENAVHHRLVPQAADYPWCSARWFEATASPAFQRTIAAFKIDRLRVRDDFDACVPG